MKLLRDNLGGVTTDKALAMRGKWNETASMMYRKVNNSGGAAVNCIVLSTNRHFVPRLSSSVM